MKRALVAVASAIAMAITAAALSGANFSAHGENPANTVTAKADFVPPTISMTDPGPNLSGTVALATTASDSASGVQSVTIERAPAGTGTWGTACTASSSPWGCSFNTASGGTPDGLYDFRAIATDNAGYSTTSATVADRRIDNTAPTGVTMTDPGTPISGVKTFSGTGADTGGSGVASLKFQYRPTSGGLWLDACTDTTSPYSCSVDTSTIGDNLYDFRALATDNAGNTTASTIYTPRRLDNTPPTVTMDDPGAYLSGTISTTAQASDGGGIASVVIQRRTTPAGAWTTICTDTTSPYSCSLNTTTLTNGQNYDFQAIATDNASRVTTSTPVTSRMVDNAAPTSVTFTNPGTPLSGTVTLSGGASDTHSGIATVTMQYSPAGAGTWSAGCVDTTSPYSCSFDTSTISDGVYDFRSLAADRAGNTTASSTTTNIRVDNFAPAVTMTDPGVALRGTVTLGATASDGGGIANVKIERSPAGAGTWTTVCTDTSSPYSCSFTTTTVTDGLYDFRATATDNAARSATSTVTSRIDNTVPTGVTMTDPGSPISGSVTFQGTASDSGSGIASLTFLYYDGVSWITLCTATSTPYSCTLDTTTIPDGTYWMLSYATDAAGNGTASSLLTNRMVDNTAPTATMGDPGALGGTETLTATAADGSGSGVTSVKIQYKLNSGSTWSDVCTDSSSPYLCTLDTTALPEGEHYDFRAISTDGAGLTTTSAVQANKVVDNTAPTVTLTDPGTLVGTETMASTAADGGSGLASVLYQYTAAGGSTWNTACTGSTSPWTCSWNTTGLSEGTYYDVHAIATDAAGNQTTSAVVTNRLVDNNTAPAGTNVQSANGGSTSGKLEVNDTITFSFSEPVSPGSILSGWTGAGAATVVVRVDDNTGTGLDRLSVWNSSDTTITNMVSDPSSGGVQLFGNYVPSGGVKFNASMTMSGSTITVTFTSLRSGSVQGTAVGNATMSWLPSAGATDLAGHALGTAAVAESGAGDKDF